MLRRFVAAFILATAFGPPAPPVTAPAQLVFVVGQGPMRPGDELLRRRLEQRGYGVIVITDGLLRESDWARKHAVVVSSSAEPALAARLRDAPVPVVVLHPFLHAPLGLSGTALGSDFGYDTTLGRTGVTVRDPRHTLAAGSTGDVGVATRPIDIGWARPASDAAVVATVSGEPDRAVAFAYEPGAAMVGLDAPARRAGFFAHEAAVPFLTPAAWRMFDAAVDWAAGRVAPPPADGEAGGKNGDAVGVSPRGPARRNEALGPQSLVITKTVLFVVGATPPANSGDDKVRQRLETNLGYTVTVRVSDATLAGTEANGKTLVLISSTANATNVGNKFRTVAVPVLLWKNDLFDDMSMAGTTSGTHFGTTTGQTQVTIGTAGDPLAAGCCARQLMRC